MSPLDFFWIFLIIYSPAAPLSAEGPGNFLPKKPRNWPTFSPKAAGSHDFPITMEVAKALGLPVSGDMPKEIMETDELFPQPTRTTPAVERPSHPSRGKPVVIRVM